MSRNYQIMILDDDVDLAESLADVLEISGHSVALAHSGESAIQVASEVDFDLAFFDVQMPGIDGVEAFLRIKEAKPDCKVYIMTGFSVQDRLDTALEHGAMGVMRKPFEVTDMIEKLQTL